MGEQGAAAPCPLLCARTSHACMLSLLPSPLAQVFLPRPPLVRGDGPIMRMRRWISQFYARGLPKVTLAHDDDGAAAAAAAAGGGGKAEPKDAAAALSASSLRQRPSAAAASLLSAAAPGAW